MKRILILILALFTLSLISLPVYAEGYDCASGRHKDVVISQREPTQTREGEITYKCELCGREYTDNIPVSGHRWSGWVIDTAATCTREGRKHRTCTVHAAHDEVEIIPAAGHKYVLAVREPTCAEAGLKTYKCSACGDTYSEPGEPAIGHDYTETVTKQPTCTEEGIKTFTCEHGSDTYTEPVPAAGHSFGEWQTEEAKEGIEGMQYRTCLYCGLREEESIPALSVSEAPPEKEPLFNTNDIIIHSVNLGVIIFFVVLLFPFAAKITWYNKKYREFLKKQSQKRQEAKKHEFH